MTDRNMGGHTLPSTPPKATRHTTQRGAMPEGDVPGPAPILFVHYGDDWIRGSEMVALELMRRLDRSRFLPFLACNQEVMASAASAMDIESFLITRPTIEFDGLRTRFQPLEWLRTTRALRRLAARIQARAYVCINGQPSMVAYYAGGRGRIPCVSYIQSFYSKRDIYVYRMNRVPTLAFCSEEIRRSIAGKARLAGATHVVHNSTDVERFHPSTSSEENRRTRARFGIPADRVVIGQVGSLIRRKGVDLLIRAVARLRSQERPVHLVLVGEGPDRGEFEALAGRLGVAGEVTFVGDTSDPAEWYRHVFDVNVLASRQEAFGIALIEGAASGLPLVAARTGGMQEIVEEGVSGSCFEPGNADDLADRLHALVVDPELRKDMGAAARDRAVEHFSAESQVRSIERILEDVLTRGQRPA